MDDASELEVEPQDNAAQGDGNEQEDPYVAEARADGWVPKEEYHGDADRWVSAREFVDRGKGINRLLRAKLDRQEQEIAALRTGVDQFKAFSEREKQRIITDKNAEITALKAQKAEAIRSGDGDAVNAIDDQLEAAREDIREAKKVEVVAPDTQGQQIFENWKTRNAWYGGDPVLTRYAERIGRSLRAEGDTATNEAFLEKVKAIVMEDHPERFKNPNRAAAASVDSGRSTTSTKDSVAAFKKNLPQKDREFMELGIKEGWFKEDEFIKDYKEL